MQQKSTGVKRVSFFCRGCGIAGSRLPTRNIQSKNWHPVAKKVHDRVTYIFGSGKDLVGRAEDCAHWRGDCWLLVALMQHPRTSMHDWIKDGAMALSDQQLILTKLTFPRGRDWCGMVTKEWWMMVSMFVWLQWFVWNETSISFLQSDSNEIRLLMNNYYD